MKVDITGKIINLSEAPGRDISLAVLVLDKDMKSHFLDVQKDKLTYDLPDGLKGRDIASVYLRIF